MSYSSDNSTIKKNPKLLDQVRRTLRTKHYSPRTERPYIHWIKQYIFFHEKRRHHFDETVPQKAVKAAIRKAGIVKHASCHTFTP